MSKLICLGRVSRETKDLAVAVTSDNSTIQTLGKCRDKSGNLQTVRDFGKTQVSAYSASSPFPACGTI